MTPKQQSSTGARTLGVIPARNASVRLPGKPLALIAGKTLVQRVWEQASQARILDRVVVATDHEEIAAHARGFGAEVILTSATHATGSDRVAEVARIITAAGEHFDYIANVQGDMPFIDPAVIDDTVKVLQHSAAEFGMATVVTPLLDEAEFLRETTVKCVFGDDRAAFYFSRAPIPFRRDPATVKVTPETPFGYWHFGLYVFRPAALQQLSTLPPHILEQREALEQLRALAHGIKIKVHIAPYELMKRSVEVNTPEDLGAAIEVALTTDKQGSNNSRSS